ncbi:carbohydrate ABC transporter permease [Enterococcus sp. DIV0242_7C1]|uniref:ABC-type maltose transport system, permease component n=1 Tax=Candidatus Enterococcus dunnyi TaxID=1834192 RepID=A0A200J035_9ENTE|nr:MULTISPECIES: carbohydrate ABC transporter permease [unclassified Enterococcus]MBO0470147.1 carbohydrate ABC transporter permease [Enterococcus sp. DIV0242_7C1]MCA5013706.1 carbohydrate ABC transporter permease [Enterococcus sp. S23]MCA5016956.1 carbohydrate ABC transporter permease [Enterococcus sp. S22(2020)]OUZ30604.1 ABC-type maltose transport system, permease component [Enterococcus sp. 9D6_DIV0238]
MRKTKNQKILKMLLYVIMITYAIITFYPFVWAVAASFKPLKEIVSGGMSIFGGNFTLANYEYILGRSDNFPRWFMNSLIVSIIGTAINLFLNTMAGYALARINFPGRERIYWGMLAMLMVPAQVLLIPNYLIISSLGMKDTFAALILPAAINIGNIFMMRQFFLSFPKDVEEAATIDGLSRTGTFFRIVMPLAKPSISTQAVFVFMSFWNEFLKPMLYMTTPSKYTLTLGLQTFKSQNAGQRWDQIMPASIISIVPIIILYIIFNKYFLQGVRMDGEK